MTYTSPELLLVGAAQNLVLAHPSDFNFECVANPTEGADQSDLIEEW